MGKFAKQHETDAWNTSGFAAWLSSQEERDNWQLAGHALLDRKQGPRRLGAGSTVMQADRDAERMLTAGGESFAPGWSWSAVSLD